MQKINRLAKLGSVAFAVAALAGLTSAIAEAQQKTPRYRVTALPANFNDGLYNLYLNNRGEVAGTVANSRVEQNNQSRAARWSPQKPNALVLLPTIGKNRPLVFVSGLNNRGDVVGSAGVNYSEPMIASYFDVFIWQRRSTTPRDGGHLPNRSSAIAKGVNNNGWLVGASGIGPSSEFSGVGDDYDSDHAFVWRGDKALLDLGIGSANAINDRGQVAGERKGRIVIWETAHLPIKAPRVLSDGMATDINERGQIVGSSAFGRFRILKIPDSFEKDKFHEFREPIQHACLWDGKRLRDLGILPGMRISSAAAINNSGHIVGTSEIEEGNEFNENARPFLWRNGKMHDLNRLIPVRSDWVLRRAYDINDRGQIVGYGLYKGKDRAFLLSPR